MADPISQEELDQIIDRAGGAETLALLARRRAQRATREYFQNLLMDRTVSPADFAVNLRVTNWTAVATFFAAPMTEQHNLQRLYQDIRADIKEALQNQNAGQLIRALLMGAKAMS
jgi:hypothetical protein